MKKIIPFLMLASILIPMLETQASPLCSPQNDKEISQPLQDILDNIMP